jgi:pyruvate formate lyase activating enzyme
MDSLGLLRENGLKTVLVSNGQINPGPLEKLAPLVDAWNIDIKAWDPEFYKQHGGFLETAKHTVEYASRFSHLEVTTLVIPEQNDNDDEIAALSEWLAGVSPETPYHLSRYFPIHKYGKAPTPKETLYRLADIARRHLKYVYVGNV